MQELKAKISYLERCLDTTEQLRRHEIESKTKMHKAILEQMNRGDWFQLKESEPVLYNFIKETIEIA